MREPVAGWQIFRNSHVWPIFAFGRFDGSLRDVGLDFDLKIGPLTFRKWWRKP